MLWCPLACSSKWARARLGTTGCRSWQTRASPTYPWRASQARMSAPVRSEANCRSAVAYNASVAQHEDAVSMTTALCSPEAEAYLVRSWSRPPCHAMSIREHASWSFSIRLQLEEVGPPTQRCLNGTTSTRTTGQKRLSCSRPSIESQYWRRMSQSFARKAAADSRGTLWPQPYRVRQT